MISSINNTLSALKAYGTKSEVQAHNIANTATQGFTPQNATLNEARGGGVQVHISQTAQERGAQAEERLQSKTDIPREMVHSAITQRGYEANLRQLEAEDQSLGTIIDIVE